MRRAEGRRVRRGYLPTALVGSLLLVTALACGIPYPPIPQLGAGSGPPPTEQPQPTVPPEGVPPTETPSLPSRPLPSTTEGVVYIPSPEGTGLPDGVLAVRVFSPAAGEARYPEGAPVVIWVPGGDDRGNLREPLHQAADVIRIVFLFPGGCKGSVCSDGVYDHRGQRSIAALRDVIRYAAGLLPDATGRTIDKAVPVPVLHDNIGLLGSSNGGNIVVAVAALHGAELSGYLRYVIQWESPVSSQIATVDLGPPRECRLPNEGMQPVWVNPRYLGYGPLEVQVDYSQLAYDPSDPVHPVFWDGNGDGVYTLSEASACPLDLDGDGVLELDEDFPLIAYEAEGGLRVYSRPATHAMADQGIFPDPWPSDIAAPEEADRFWDLREAVRLYPAALQSVPDLMGMVLASTQDHVQIAPDRPHIRQAFEGWLAAGGWVRVNPGPEYVVEIDPGLAERSLPDNPPNTPPADWAAPDYTYPDPMDQVYQSAAVHEMADRVQGREVP